MTKNKLLIHATKWVNVNIVPRKEAEVKVTGKTWWYAERYLLESGAPHPPTQQPKPDQAMLWQPGGPLRIGNKIKAELYRVPNYSLFVYLSCSPKTLTLHCFTVVIMIKSCDGLQVVHGPAPTGPSHSGLPLSPVPWRPAAASGRSHRCLPTWDRLCAPPTAQPLVS